MKPDPQLREGGWEMGDFPLPDLNNFNLPETEMNFYVERQRNITFDFRKWHN